MAPLVSLNKALQQQLLLAANESIDYGLKHGSIMPVGDLSDYDELLQADGASFVTLTIKGNLRGCVGSLQAYQPLVQDVVQHAYGAAFKDSRFPPLQEDERDRIQVHLSVLNPAEPMQVDSEKDLYTQLRPSVDGLILSDQGHSATFLPQVWEQLPMPEQFVAHLKQKAGLPVDYWSETIRFMRYTVQSFE